MNHDRRSVLTALGLALPFGLDTRFARAAITFGPAPLLRHRPFEELVREAFRSPGSASADGWPCRRVEIGHSEEVLAGVQGCHNDRPFAGFPAGHLRIVRVGSGPGPIVSGVRLYVTTVDVTLTDCRAGHHPGRALDFATLPPATVLVPADATEEPTRPLLTRVERRRQHR